MQDNANIESAKKILKYSFWLLSKREVSEKMLKDSIRKKFPDAVPRSINQVIEFLTENRYLSDERFAEMYIRYGVSRKWGPLKIRFKLKEKGIAEELIKSNEDQWNSQDMDEITEYCQKKYKLDKIDLKKCGYEEKYKLKAKVMRHLISRGFDGKQIKIVTSVLF